MSIILYKKLFWRVKLVGANGEIMLVSETYFSKGNAKRAAMKLATALDIPYGEE